MINELMSVCIGYVRNTETLDARTTDFYSFRVQAEDCGGRVSEDATVHVQVNPVCRRGLTGLAYSLISAPRLFTTSSASWKYTTRMPCYRREDRAMP